MANAMKPGQYGGEPQLGIPHPGPAYGYPAVTTAPPQQMPPPQYYVQPNPYSAGMRPPNAIYGPPLPGMGLQETFYADTPAPFECPHCGKPGLTNVKYGHFLLFKAPLLICESMTDLFLHRAGHECDLLEWTDMLSFSMNFRCRSSLSAAAWVGCLATICGLCFLTRSCDCLWHKHHYCDHCGQKVSISLCSFFCIFTNCMRHFCVGFSWLNRFIGRGVCHGSILLAFCIWDHTSILYTSETRPLPFDCMVVYESRLLYCCSCGM